MTMKRFLAGMFALLFLIVAGLIIAPNFIDWNAYKGMAEEKIKQRAGLELNIKGNLAFVMLPSPRFVVEDVTVKAPEQKKYDIFLKFERLDVAVSLLSLTQRQLNITKMTIVKPTLALEKQEDGSFKFQTNQSQNQPSEKPAAPAMKIALDQITIKDGEVLYYDHSTNSETKIEKISVDLSAGKINGPYAAKGSLSVNNHALTFDAKTDAYNQENGIISPNITLTSKQHGATFQYSGAVKIDANPSLQGQIKAQLNDNTAPASIKGLITADAKTISLNDIDIKMQNQVITGALKVQINPLTYEASLKTGSNGSYKITGSYKDGAGKRAKANVNITADEINFDDLNNAPENKEANVAESLSALSLPLDLDVTLKTNKIIMQSKHFNAVNAAVKFSENAINISKLSVADFAGTAGQISAKINAINKAPTLKASVSLKSQNIKQTLQKLDIDTGALPEKLKNLTLKAELTGTLDTLDMKANINVIGAKIITKGKIIDPENKPKLEDIILQIKHENVSTLIFDVTGSPVTDQNFTKPLNLYTKLNQKGQNFNLSEVKGNISGLTVQGDLDIDTHGKVPNVKGDLKLGNMALDSIAQKKSKTSADRWSKEPMDVSALHAINADIKLSANIINYGSWPLQNPSLHLKLKDGNADITDLKAQIFGGSIDTTLKIQTSTKPRQPVYFDSASSFKNVDLGKLAKSLIGTQLVKLSGSGDLDMTLKSTGASVAALTHDLSGQGTVRGKAITLEGVDVAKFARALSGKSKPGDTVLGLWKGTTAGGNTQFETLTGDFTAKDGIVALNNINLDGPVVAIETNGTLNLPNWTLATKHNMIVKNSDVPPYEISYSGSLDNPTQTFGQGLINDYLKRKAQRKINDLISDKLGFPANDNNKTPAPQQEPQEQEQQKQPETVEDAAEEAIKSILDGLLR